MTNERAFQDLKYATSSRKIVYDLIQVELTAKTCKLLLISALSVLF